MEPPENLTQEAASASAAQSDWEVRRRAFQQRRVERMKHRTVLSDCIVMLRYALDEGLQLPDTLITDVAALDALLIANNDDPLSERPVSLRAIAVPPASTENPAATGTAAAGAAGAAQTAQQQAAAQQQTGTGHAPAGQQMALEPARPRIADADSANPDKLLLRIHNALSALVAPATAISLRATDPDVVGFGLPWIAKLALVGALGATFVFILSVANPSQDTNKKTNSSTTSVAPSPTPASAP